MKKFLKVDEKWSIEYDPFNNDRPVAWYRYGVFSHFYTDRSNAGLSMFYALLNNKPLDKTAFEYAFQDDANTSGLRITDLCYTSFMIAKRPNEEDGGPSDWFTDTRPKIIAGIQTIKDNIENGTFE